MSNHSNMPKSKQAMRQLRCHKVLEAASDASSDGKDLWKVLAQQMGHRSDNTTEHYVSLAEREAKDNERTSAHTALLLAALTGMRLDEVLSLRISAVGYALREVEAGICPHRGSDLDAIGRAQHFGQVECESGRHIPIDQLLSGQDDGTPPPSHPPVTGLTRQHHDDDRISALTAHLDALDKQLAPRRRKSRG
jgi:hypothetical protein